MAAAGASSTGDDGRRRVAERLPRAVSELLQHEIDHLDGVLSIDRAEGAPADAVIYRRVYDAAEAAGERRFVDAVDYVIEPTV
mmetsp:Transcript_17335/g.60990  ORF Transcript_17335/g.60990 Transcript_17335/m.60990 type:complete len:83 (+) Transcript_17335:99-347(+)